MEGTTDWQPRFIFIILVVNRICFLVMIFVNSLDFDFFTDFKDDPDIYVFPNLKYVGIELWQVNFLFLFLCIL